MSHYLAHHRSDVPPAGVAAALSFLALAGCVFVYSLMLRSNDAVFDWGRQAAAQLGWATPSVSQAIPMNRVIVLLDRGDTSGNTPRAPTTAPVRIAPTMTAPAMTASAPPGVPSEPESKVPEPLATREASRTIAAIPPVPALPPESSMPARPPSASAQTSPAVQTPPVSARPAEPADPADPPQAAAPAPQTAALAPGPAPSVRELPAMPPEKFSLDRLRERAQEGLPAAQLALAQRYHIGDGVAASALKALYWYHRAAGLGSVEAQFNLGLMYYLGDGVPKDLVSAYRWISLAAEQKDRRAKVVLDGLHRSLPGPVFTALVFPEPVVLGPAPTRNPPLRSTPIQKPTEGAFARTARYAPEPAQSQAESLRHGMNTVSFWKPSVFLLGNKPLP
ncbi:MAG: hypothetical protein WD407_01300 [Rhodospirillales bacterium]